MEKANKLATQAKESLEKFVETAKLKTNLATMESKDAWEKLERQFDIIQKDIKHFTAGIKQDTDEARLQAHLALMDAKERWQVVKDEVDHLIAGASESAESKIDHARVQAALAKLEAEDLIDEKRYGEQFQHLGQEIKDEWYTFLSSLDERVIDFINKFPLR